MEISAANATSDDIQGQQRLLLRGGAAQAARFLIFQDYFRIEIEEEACRGGGTRGSAAAAVGLLVFPSKE